eukprot:7987852-Pyramimonas_sp.AAC.1
MALDEARCSGSEPWSESAGSDLGMEPMASNPRCPHDLIEDLNSSMYSIDRTVLGLEHLVGKPSSLFQTFSNTNLPPILHDARQLGFTPRGTREGLRIGCNTV